MGNSTSNDYLNILSQFSADLVQKTTVEDVLWTITEKAISHLNFEDCVVYLLDEKGEFLVQKAAYGPKNPTKREIADRIRIPIGKGIVGAVAESGVGEIISDCASDKRYIADDANRSSEMAVPIIHEGDVIGVIDSEHSQKSFFTNEHLSVIGAIASITAIRLHQITDSLSVATQRDSLVLEVATKESELKKTLADLQQSNEILEELLREKSELLRALHHRVKNQMQMLYSLINLQAESVDEKQIKDNLLVCMNRVRCMGLGYQLADGLMIDPERYLRALNDELNANYGLRPAIPFKVSSNTDELEIEKTVQLGFIMVDLFASGMKVLSEIDDPSSSIDLIIVQDCRIRINSNWWDLKMLSEMTEIFIAQFGARKVEDDGAGLTLVCG